MQKQQSSISFGLFEEKQISKDLLNFQEASKWATQFTGKEVSISNISYLVQYGLVKKFINETGVVNVSKKELTTYYESRLYKRQINWKEKLGEDINWHLSFENITESETTKHVHRLHPYKGKFIPQLVEYFLDGNTDEFKKNSYFKPGDVILDPFCGSGTTLVQSSELGLHAVGIDVSMFNSLISNIKISEIDLINLNIEIKKINFAMQKFVSESGILKFDRDLLSDLNKFNQQYFPSPEFKYKARRGEINPDVYGNEFEKIYLERYKALLEKYNINLSNGTTHTFLDKWFIKPIKQEILYILSEIEKVQDNQTKNILRIILSRTIRSCRATTHSDLVTLFDPIITTYYCTKHGKICKPLFTILQKWLLYSSDTVKRFNTFKKLRSNTMQYCLTGDSRNLNVTEALYESKPELSEIIKNKGIKGIFSSPPYVGLINYHEQHAYAYELFGFPRNDELEIGPLFKGKGKSAQESYIEGISKVLINCKRFLSNDYDIFLVANDKNNLYSKITENSHMQIVEEFKRPVLNRSERDKNAYAESIFHIKEK